jgi:cytidylate kinase
VEYRVLTVNREFGSGGGRIAEAIAMRLGWKLLDKDIIDAIAYAAHVDSSVVRHYDEHVDSWLRRINQQAMRSAALAAGLELGDNAVFDAQEMVKISQHQPDVFHVFVYAPCLERIARLRDRLEPGANIEQRIRTVDGERAKYLQQFFGKCWTNPHLYDLMISSRLDEEFTARAILYAMTGKA